MTEHVFRVRWYQRALHEAFMSGEKSRFLEIAHRRWGKDEIALKGARDKALQRPGSYWHCLPEYGQGRKAIWTAVNPHTGKRRIDEAFPPEVVKSRNNQEMFIELVNGSTWQIIGSDNYDSTVGASPCGITYSEWALANPSAWAYHRPMVEENNGWALFITTPRGDNHAKAMHDMAKDNPKWFCEVSTVDDTGALTAGQLSEAKEEYEALYGIDLGRAMFEQEYYCSFSGAMIGAYWGAELARVEREGRIAPVKVDESQPVHTAWDLGKAINNPIWCFQVIRNQLRIVDFYQPESEDLAEWCMWLSNKGYNGNDYVPHDILVSEWGSGRTRLDILKAYKRKPIRIPKVSVADGLQAGRMAINAAEFADTESVRHGINGLKNYRREWDTDLKRFRDNPVKDWAEHIGSAWRYLGLSWKEVPEAKKEKPKPKELIYTARPDGSAVSNMSVSEAIDDFIKRKRAG